MLKFLILGAGPSGLTFANKLKMMGEDSFILLESESEAGGLCRSKEVDGAPLDIGGGHFLDVRRPNVNDFLFSFMPEYEWNKYERDSRIDIKGTIINHPFEANIWQMDIDRQVEYLKSIAYAGCNTGVPMPNSFVDWISWKLGNKIAEEYMIPYNTKIFAEELDELGTYWLEKLPNVSFEETLRSCLTHRAYGEQPGHAQFYYPKKFGYGELWSRMADTINKNIVYDSKVTSLDFNNHLVMTESGEEYNADIIITTIPWVEYKMLIGMPEDIQHSIKKLKFSSIDVRYYKENLDTDAHWIYYPNPSLAYHRRLVRHNFCPTGNGYWTETRAERVNMISDLENKNFHYLNKYAYPLNTIGKPQIMNTLLNWCASRNVYGLGRWGEHQHYNSDVTVELAMTLANKLNNEKKDRPMK